MGKTILKCANDRTSLWYIGAKTQSFASVGCLVIVFSFSFLLFLSLRKRHF